jgi:Predicted Fe-S oxidoreductases
MTATASLCPVCYREVPAGLFLRDGAVWMRKACPVHGGTEAMVERDASFWRACQQSGRGSSRAVYDQISLIEATDRCNLACRHCYHQPDTSSADRPADWIVAKAMAAPTANVCLMGAEPTMRDDLAAIVEGIRHGGKAPLIYSNGIRLADPALVDALASAGLDGLSLSLHDGAYHGPKPFAKVLKALENVVAAGLPLGQVSFTVDDLESGLRRALGHILDLSAQGLAPTDFCLRTPAPIGRAFEGGRLFVSDVFAAVNALAVERGLALELDPAADSNPHHVRVRFSGVSIQLIHWPDVSNIDLRFMGMGPWASFIDGTFGSFAHQAILRDGLKKGWWQGRRLAGD